jgi:glycosyltransferase involved in cell wall biosynthesis
VAIESMATGTPVIARRAGALTETIEHGVTGFLVDDVSEAALAVEKLDELDRAQIRRLTLERFSVERMTDEYEDVYRRLVKPAPTLVTTDGPRPMAPVHPYVAAEPQRLGHSSR